MPPPYVGGGIIIVNSYRNSMRRPLQMSGNEKYAGGKPTGVEGAEIDTPKSTAALTALVASGRAAGEKMATGTYIL